MSHTLNQLKNKANRLQSKLRANGIKTPNKHKLHLFAYVVGENNWDTLVHRYKQTPRPYTGYQPCPHALGRAAGISFDLAKSILDEISWPSLYVPVFNTLPVSTEGCIIVPVIFTNSHIFSCHRKRRKHCLLDRIALFDDECNMNKDYILYSGESLNFYDETIFFSLLYSHPADTPVGRDFYFSQQDLESELERIFSTASLEASLDRMRDCRIWIPKLNFFGPIISSYQKVKSRVKNKRAYKISLNPELTKLYHDKLYGDVMDSGNLFYHNPDYTNAKKNVDYRAMRNRMDRLREKDFIRYSKQLSEFWPTHNNDIAAIYAIIAKNAKNGQAGFTLLENFLLDEDHDRIEITMPKWWMQAHHHFTDLYGQETGSLIFAKAMERFTSPLFQDN